MSPEVTEWAQKAGEVVAYLALGAGGVFTASKVKAGRHVRDGQPERRADVRRGEFNILVADVRKLVKLVDEHHWRLGQLEQERMETKAQLLGIAEMVREGIDGLKEGLTNMRVQIARIPGAPPE